jgi:hypothetical protein
MDLAPLQAFADARRRPSVFLLFGDEPIDRGLVIALNEELAGRRFQELDLVVHSAGGSAHAAYQAMALLRVHARAINCNVPFWAKGAAMLLCIGSDRIILGEQAELGPLDVQVYEERPDGGGAFRSALDTLKDFEHLQTLSLEALASAMRFIATNYEMDQDDALGHAMAFVDVTTGSITSQIDSETIGQCGRELAVASEYGARLLSGSSTWPPKKINEVIDQLVYGYPSHEYVVDRQELTNLGFELGRFALDQRTAASGLLASVEEVDGSLVKLLEPQPTSAQPVSVQEIAGSGAGAEVAGSKPALASEPSGSS